MTAFAKPKFAIVSWFCVIYIGQRSASLADIEAVRVTPAFKGRWRLHVRRAGNGDYESAAGSRDEIHNAAERLRLAMPKLR